jgi:hypothetical protein
VVAVVRGESPTSRILLQHSRQTDDTHTCSPTALTMARDQWKRPERVTLGAILVARFVLSIPGPGLLFTVVYFLNNPSLQRGFAEPLEWTSLLSSNPGYYWATFCGAFSLLASFLLQAYGKKPEYPDPRVIGTERIFSWDAILEVLVWAVSTCLSSVLMALGDRSYSPAGKMSTILSTIAFTFLACVAGVVSAKNIINTARERLTFEQFRAFVIRQALLIGRLTILTAALAIYTSLAIGSHDLPTGYVNLYGSIFPRGVACGNESTAITLIESLPCGLTPLCGFDTWRTACWRMQLAEGVRSMNLFLPMVYVHMLIMYVLYAIYSHGEKLEQKNQWRSAISATIKQNRIAPIQEEDSLAQPESPNPSRPQLTPAKSLTNRSLKRISSSLMTRGVSDSHMSDKGQGGEEPKAHSSKTSYLHLFKPHMIAVLLCLVVVNAMMVYLSVRWLFLGSLFAHPMAVSNAKNLEETLQLPGVCYGSCGTSAFALFIALWILIFVILNVKELWLFLSGRKAEGKELKLQQQEEELQSQRLKAENEAGECSFYFVSADFIRKHPSNRPVPKFQRLKKIKGALIKMTLNFEALLCGQYSNSPDFCVVSHRWMTPENPDEDLAQVPGLPFPLHFRCGLSLFRSCFPPCALFPPLAAN